ncbi:MAG: M28 family peptidase [Chthonomonas sp.]|nr:M28 family peptidase [Chthonomonas sp.]
MRLRRWLSSCALLCAAQVWAQGDPGTIKVILSEGMDRNQAAVLLKELSYDIGPRLTGSKNLARGQQWAMQKLRSWGWQNVRLEKWGEVPFGFDRGPSSFGRMNQPVRWDLMFSSAAWMPGTDGPRKALTAIQPKSMAEFELRKDQLKGKWILMETAATMRGSRPLVPLTPELRTKNPALAALEDVEAALDKLGIAGKVFGGADKQNWVHTSGSWAPLVAGNAPKDTRVNIRFGDFRWIRRMTEAGRPVELEFNLDQYIGTKPVPQYNLVADWPGSSKADEWVMFGGHFDSWDGPGSQGTSDNGTGSSVSLEAARLIAMAKAKPVRSMRIILWSGEEQGLYGSAADAKKWDRQKLVAVFNEDSGSNYQSSLSVMPAWRPIIERALSDYAKAFPEQPIVVSDAGGQWMRGGGSDHASYLAQGIPAFAWGKTGPQTYRFIWHTANDRYTNAFLPGLRQMSVNTALLAYNVACAPEKLWRPEKWPLPAEPAPRSGGIAPEDEHDHEH